MREIDALLIERLRAMARDGRLPSEMFKVVTEFLGTGWHIVEVIKSFRLAFCLSLGEAKPLACLSGYANGTERELYDAALLDELLTPDIRSHIYEWNGE